MIIDYTSDGRPFPIVNLDKQEKIIILSNFFNNSKKTIDHSKEVLKPHVSYGYVIYEMFYKDLNKISLKFLVK